MTPLPTVTMNRLRIPVLGQGTWHIGDNPSRASEEKAALRRGITLGMTLIDTAEMYGNGCAETLTGDALQGIPREAYQLVSKVYPHNAGRARIFEHCDASLRRLRTDYLDVYLLHWRGSIPMEETVTCMQELVQRGKILRWGVSNFDTADMQALWDTPGGEHCAVNQVLYHLGSRGIEFELLPWLRAHNVATMAYCPLAQAGALRKNLFSHDTLRAISAQYRITIPQLLLAFVLRQAQVIAIPKAGNIPHVEENAQACDVQLSDADWRAIDAAFPPPSRKMLLDIE